MTNPAWQQPTAPQPPVRRTPWKKIGIGVASLLFLCCGGTVAIGLSTDDPSDTNATGDTATAAPFAAPARTAETTIPAPTAPSPTQKTTPTQTAVEKAAAPSPSKTTARPKRTTPPTRPTTTRPKPEPTNTRTASSQSGVRPGAFCSPEGARGTTSKGTRMRCTAKAGEDRARWRKA
ncbi:hypothetical protein AB0M20_31265 [Actinoplanes sp. NPDC051633]|uniref:hypothetical protein n=1 Tax=Actinoplanes sp. NPDC051633 TaxID=3155670 RepID=UPI00344ABCCA